MNKNNEMQKVINAVYIRNDCGCPILSYNGFHQTGVAVLKWEAASFLCLDSSPLHNQWYRKLIVIPIGTKN